MIELEKPATWLVAPLNELYQFIGILGSSLKKQQETASQLEKAGAAQAAKAMRKPENLQAIDEVNAVFSSRMRSERPGIDDVLGADSVPADRLKFAKQYGYPLETVLAEQAKLIT